MQIEDSDNEGEDAGLDREQIANQLFDDEVSTNCSKKKKNSVPEFN